MKRTVTEVQKDLNEKRSAIKAIVDKLDAEKRSMTDEELAQYNTLETEVRSLSTELDKLNAELRMRSNLAGLPTADPEKREIEKNFSLQAAVRAAVTGEKEGFIREMHDEGIKEMRELSITQGNKSIVIPAVALRTLKRAQTVTGSTSATGDQGGYAVQTDVLGNEFVGAVRAESGLGQLGARVLEGLRGNVQIPFGSNLVTATWEGETDSTGETQLNMEKINGTPKRVSALVQYTMQLLAQESISVENWLREELFSAVSRGLDSKAINGSGSGSNPKGILAHSAGDGVNVVAMGTDGAALTYAKLVDLETAVANANGAFGAMAMYTNAKVRGAAKKTAKESGGASGYLWDSRDMEGPLLGYKTVISNNVPNNLTKGSGSALSALIFANWQELFLMQWGGLEIIVDPYTNKKPGIIDLQMDSFWDIQLRRKACFGYIKDIVA